MPNAKPFVGFQFALMLVFFCRSILEQVSITTRVNILEKFKAKPTVYELQEKHNFVNNKQ